MSEDNRFGRLVKQVRMAKGLSIRQVAAQAGVSAIYVCDIERGNRSPALETVNRLADALELDADELIDVMLRESKPMLAAWLDRRYIRKLEVSE